MLVGGIRGSSRHFTKKIHSGVFFRRLMSAPTKRALSNGLSPALKKMSLDSGNVSWQAAMQKVIQSVVSIHFCSVTPFDTEDAYVSEATGFVVDSRNGIIMTNRHVVGPGPFYGYAVFENHEECSVKAVYRDPVHDFGFLKFNPEHIRHIPVVGLDLRPDLARVGSEIRIVGNDAGEKLSILSGVISRLDRNAPDYGELTYNDFNTEYIQAAASASGGSSGSPVVDVNANVLALQAGGASSASTDFFLPLHRGKRALECLQQQRPITRGTIQVQWLLKPYDECTRLGLSEESQAKARTHFPAATGLLVCEMVLPEGPGAGLLEEGDILLELNGEPIFSFQQVDSIFDDSVEQKVELLVERNGEKVAVSPTVMDLHKITPNRYVEFSGAIFHNISYQVARLYGLPCRGVYIADTGIAFHVNRDKSGWLLLEVNNKPIKDLDEFIEVVKEIPDETQLPVKLVHVTDLYTIRNLVVPVDRHWAKDIRVATRNDQKGLWDFETIGSPIPPKKLPTQMTRYKKINIAGRGASCAKLVRSFVRVESFLPLRIEGFATSAVVENGVVLDVERGYVLVSRYCIPHQLCDVRITIADSISVPAKVKFLHPQQNFAIIQYDPSLVDANMESVNFSQKPLEQGEELMFIGYNNNRVVMTETTLTDIVTISIPQSHEFSPRYRGINLESLGLDAPMIAECSSGIVSDFDGTVRGLWLSFMGDVQDRRDRQFRLAIDTVEIGRVVRELQNNGTVDPRFVDIELGQTPIVYARVNGVDEKWVRMIAEKQLRPQFASILRVSNGTSKFLKEGDIVLAADGELITYASQLTNLPEESVKLTILRAGKEFEVDVPTTLSSQTLQNTIVLWNGMTIHSPHHAVSQQVKELPSHVYVSHVGPSSPSNQRGIGPTQFITHVDRKPTPTVKEFYDIVKNLPDDTDIQVHIISFDGIPSACSIKTNYHYFPTSMLQLQGDNWVVDDPN